MTTPSSSKQIAAIAGVVDGMAFQTRILALHAAVEAARAGEPGRVFAAVAAEMRGLAQRCADAARTIERLADGGDTRANIAGVRQWADVARGVASAAAERMRSLTPVDGRAASDAVPHEATVDDASAAASWALREQSLRLAELVAALALEVDTVAPTSAPAHVAQRAIAKAQSIATRALALVRSPAPAASPAAAPAAHDD